MMVIQNSCRVNREHAHIYSGVLWTWTWPDAMVSTPCALWLKSEAWSYYLFEIWTKKAQNLKNRTHCLVFGCPVFRGLLYTTAIGSIDIRSLVTIFLTKTAWNNFVTGLNQSRFFLSRLWSWARWFWTRSSRWPSSTRSTRPSPACLNDKKCFVEPHQRRQWRQRAVLHQAEIFFSIATICLELISYRY